MVAAITEENCMPALYAFADDFYGDLIRQSINMCPYDLDLGDPELIYKQLMTWFMLEKRGPDGLTVLDKFIDSEVGNPYLQSKMRQMGNVTYDTFLIEQPADENRIVVAKSASSNKTYRIEVLGEHPEVYMQGGRFISMIYPWHEDGAYRTAGITQVEMPENFGGMGSFNPRVQWFEQQQMERAQELVESAPGNRWPVSRSLFGRYPAKWVNGICDKLDLNRRGMVKAEKADLLSEALSSGEFLSNLVSRLDEDELSALKLVVKNHCRMKHTMLCRQFGEDDTDILWRRDSASVVGRLRQLGVLVMGKKLIGTRTYRMVIIPKDIAANLVPILRFGIFGRPK